MKLKCQQKLIVNKLKLGAGLQSKFLVMTERRI